MAADTVKHSYDVFARNGEKIGRIDVLEDGLIRQTMEGVSNANHATADGFVGMIARAGANTTIEKRHDQGHHHAHVHTHTKVGQ
jgi:hypothetical protein